MPDGFDAAGDEPVVDATEAAEGQATDQGSSSPMWDSWIQENAIPETAQEYVRRFAKHQDGLTTQKFQEHAEFRKQFEPYKGVDGLTDWDPDELSKGLGLLEALMDEERAPEAVLNMARHLGLVAEEDADEDLEGEDSDAEPDLTGVLDERLAPIEQFLQQRQQEEAEKKAQDYIDSSFRTIEKDLGRKLSDAESARIRNLASGFAHGGDEDPIATAWNELKSHRTDVESELLAQKRKEPGRPEVGPSAPPAAPPSQRGGLSLEDQGNAQLREWIAQNAA